MLHQRNHARQTLNSFDEHAHEHVEVVSSVFHFPRVGRTLGLYSPQMDEACLDEDLATKILKWRSNPFIRDKANLDKQKTKYANPLDIPYIVISNVSNRKSFAKRIG